MSALLDHPIVRSERRHNVLGVGVSAMDYGGACDAIVNAAKSNRGLTVTALAVHGVMTGALNPQHRKRLNALDIVLPDGQPVRWALNALFQAKLRDRVYGPNLMLYVCERAEILGLSIGLYGNRTDVLEDLRVQLLSSFPNLEIVAAIPSLFRKISRADQSAFAERLTSCSPDLLFVGLGCPRQEVWLYENRARFSFPLIAVGAAFDFHAKRVAQAPRWMQDRGFEWLFRLSREPRRLWRRYLLLNPLFLGMFLLQYLGIRVVSTSQRFEEAVFEGYA